MSLFSLSPLDGRYQSKVSALAQYFSEAALMKYRVKVEIEWFIYLCNEVKLENTSPISPEDSKTLRGLYEQFSEKAAERVKEIEATTNHDVKAIEYFIKENLPAAVKELQEFIHFGCTSEDINNLAYGLMIKDAGIKEILPALHQIIGTLYELAKKHKSVPMLSRTHGQAASPTTVGKELINVVARLQRQYKQLDDQNVYGKMNGAVGNFNAHCVAYPEENWADLSAKFIQDYLGLAYQAYTTQIEPHDYLAEIFHGLMRVDTILIDLCRDIWSYISYGFFKQKLKDGEVGSSTMPHKVNPIDFENAEGNFGLARALYAHMADKLPISRMQRDLSDSTVQRNIGSAFGYSFLGYSSLMKGLSKLELNQEALNQDLENNWEVLAEPIQMVLRKYKVEGAYEKLKELTRGHKIDQQGMQNFIDSLTIPGEAKQQLLKLTPQSYIGLAVELVDSYQL